jgi:hypothetical protein
MENMIPLDLDQATGVGEHSKGGTETVEAGAASPAKKHAVRGKRQVMTQIT